MSTFYKNYCRLCTEAGKTVSGVASDIGLSNAAASGWKKGKMPNDTTLGKLSKYFNVPVEELTREDAKKESAAFSGLSDAKREAMEWLLNHDDETARRFIESAKKILGEE